MAARTAVSRHDTISLRGARPFSRRNAGHQRVALTALCLPVSPWGPCLPLGAVSPLGRRSNSFRDDRILANGCREFGRQIPTRYVHDPGSIRRIQHDFLPTSLGTASQTGRHNVPICTVRTASHGSYKPTDLTGPRILQAHGSYRPTRPRRQRDRASSHYGLPAEVQDPLPLVAST